MSGPEDFNSDRTGKQVETMKGMAQIARQVAAISRRLLREWGATHSVTPEQQQELEQRFNETVAATDPNTLFDDLANTLAEQLRSSGAGEFFEARDHGRAVDEFREELKKRLS